MTAEIAILNKSAVALATDSMVTYTDEENVETPFNSENKLFELSQNQPIGLMIYGSSTYLGIPLSGLVKEFRNLTNFHKTIEHAAGAFLRFLQEVGSQTRIQKPSFVTSLELRLVDQFILSLSEETKEFSSESELNSKIINWLRLREKDVQANSTNQSQFLSGDSSFIFSLTDDTKGEIRNKIHEISEKIWPETVNKCVDLVSEGLRTFSSTETATGLVFAGYGESDIFPTLVWVEIDGFISNSLRYIYREKIDIDREGPKASLMPFAQKDVVESFVYGFNDQAIATLGKHVSSIVSLYAATLADRLEREHDGASEITNDIISVAPDMAKTLADIFETRFVPETKKKRQKQIEEIIEFMPKPDLAEMAEALVGLTSTRYRVLAGVDTVGGPVDVAMISKEDGFVWVKRKHYFKSELNHRYHSKLATKLGRI